MPAEAVADAPKLSGLTIQVTSVLGTGSGSTVMRVMDRTSGREFAMKVIKREGPSDDIAIDRGRAEVEASAKLGHPAILKCHDFALRRSWFRVARAEVLMELVEGKTLDELGTLAIGNAILIFERTASALAHMHRRGVIHGDLRPGKVMLSRKGQVKVRGYGISQVREPLKPQVRAKGPYAAPERVKEKAINDRVDVYSLGATMYRVATGKAPGEELADGKLATPAKLNPKIPAALNNLIVSCMSSKPERRPPDMYEVAKQLEALVKEMALKESALAGLAAKEA
jgi:serine/threonine protein kinase